MLLKTGLLTLLVVATAQMAGAKTKLLKDNPVPAEFPPDSFTGLQYVDSEGCAFIRAGSADKVVWVPRVTRRRELVCGLEPSLARKDDGE